MSIRWSIEWIVDVLQLEPELSSEKTKCSQLCDLLMDHQHIALLLRDYAAEETISQTIGRRVRALLGANMAGDEGQSPQGR